MALVAVALVMMRSVMVREAVELAFSSFDKLSAAKLSLIVAREAEIKSVAFIVVIVAPNLGLL